jgi:hypothetical protein
VKKNVVLKESALDVVIRLRSGRARNRASIAGGAKAFFSLQRPDRLWGPRRSLFKGYGAKGGLALKLAT